jgi:hypothetical protein
MTQRRLFLKKLANVITACDEAEIPVVVFSMYRTADEQRKLFREGKSKCDGYNVKSRHQEWLAADLGILNDEGTDILWNDDRYAQIGEFAAQNGLTWGGAWSAFGGGDIYHLELSCN